MGSCFSFSVVFKGFAVSVTCPGIPFAVPIRPVLCVHSAMPARCCVIFLAVACGHEGAEEAPRSRSQ